MTNSIAAYTALFGPYDDVAPALYGGVLFTDQGVKPRGWQVRRVEAPFDDLNLSSRFYFCQSCRVLAEYEITVEHGADVQLLMSPQELVERYLPDGYDLASYPHPLRDSVYDEANMCARLRKDCRVVIGQQMDRYRAEGFPGDDLSTCIILIRRNNQRVQEFEDLWWSEVQRGSRRNQLSFDYCRWKLGMPVARLPGSPYQRHSPIMAQRKHLVEQRYA